MEETTKKSSLIQAALELFTEQGIHNTPMSQIAERADIGVGTIYRYFPSKEALIDSLYLEINKRISQSTGGYYSEELSVHDNFLHYFHQIILYFIQHPAELSLIGQYENHPQSVNGIRQNRQDSANPEIGFGIIFRNAIKEKLVKELPAGMLASIAVGMMVSLAKYYIITGGDPNEAELARGVEAIWDAIRK